MTEPTIAETPYDYSLLHGPEVCRLAEISYRQLDYWVRKGYLRPDRPAAGSGTQRGFSPAEVAVARRIVQLVSFGLPPGDAADAARRSYTTWLGRDVKVSIWSLP